MKPLELTIYPKLKWPRNGAEIEPYRKQWRQERKVIESKRLTDAELAAEHWRAKWTGLMHESKFNSVLSDKHRAMIATVERFMDLPHYDQEEATA